MTATRLADIIDPAKWTPYMQERTRDKSALWQSGVVEQNAQTDELAKGAGSIIDMPLFKDLTGDSEILSDTDPLTVNKITTGADKACKHFRGKAWGSSDLAQAIAEADPMAAIADLAGSWWARDMQKTLIYTLKGIFASALASHVVDISSQDGNNATGANKISATTTIDAFATLGDASDSLVAMAMHSVIYHSLLKQDLITFERYSEQGEKIATYLGKAVIVDDGLPKVAGTTSGWRYSTYLFGPGVIKFGEGDPKEPVEMDRDILQGEEYLVNRRHFLLHPAGVKWAGDAAGVSPTNAELATSGNWTLVYEHKNVPIVELKTNG